jgi:predicted ABC-type ATPase
MSASRPTLYVIAGPNGAGKTTFAREFLPKFADCREFINADLIAVGLSPFSPSSVAVSAGRILLRRIRDLSRHHGSFAFETTLSGRSYLSLFRRLKRIGYRIELFYLWIPSADFAVQRVKDRVSQGGHSVPEKDVRRRFARGLRNLFCDYLPLLDVLSLFDNSKEVPVLIAGHQKGRFEIINDALFQNIKRSAESFHGEKTNS